MLPSDLLLLSSKLGYILTGKDPEGDVKVNQLLSCFVMTQSVPELNLFTMVDGVVNKNPDLSDLWHLDTISICDPEH